MLTRGKKIAVVLGASVLALAFIVPYLFPVSKLIPSLQARISERIHQPVSIGSLRLFLLPVPYLQARRISIGNGPLMEIDSIVIYPRLLDLLSSTKRIRAIRLDGVQAKSEVFGMAGAWLKAESAARTRSGEESEPVEVDRITLRNAVIRFQDFSVSGVSADLRFGSGELLEFRASQGDGHLKVVSREPINDSWKLDITAHDWKVPGGFPVTFSRLEGPAVISERGIEFKQLSGALYSGTASGAVALTWTPSWSISGEVQISGVDVEPLIALLNKDLSVNGKLIARPRFSSHAPNASSLLSALNLESDFSIAKGSIQKVDLVAAAKNPFDKQAGKGGKTEFTELSGHLVLDPTGYDFTDLKISSGLFKASGDLTVAKDLKLDGLIAAELNGTTSLMSVPLSVTGTVEDPTLRPSKGALAGAVAGSVLLPGIGTALGMKAGQFTEKLLGKNKSQPALPAARSGRQ